MSEETQLTTKSPSSAVAIGGTGALAFAHVGDVIEVARLMSKSQTAVPKHLRDNPGACLGVALQASEWQMSPFAVANKSYVVNDRLAYEAQMINAVILRRAPIRGRMKFSYNGEGEKRRCKVSVELNDGTGSVEYESPEIGKIPVKNSPLWKGDPDQQLAFYSSRAMCRRHFPDVIMGVYSKDELEDAPPEVRDVTPAKDPPTFLPREQAAVVDVPEPTPAPTPAPPQEHEQTVSAKDRLHEAMESDAVRRDDVINFLQQNDRWEDGAKWKDLDEVQATFALSNWAEITGGK